MAPPALPDLSPPDHYNSSIHDTDLPVDSSSDVSRVRSPDRKGVAGGSGPTSSTTFPSNSAAANSDSDVNDRDEDGGSDKGRNGSAPDWSLQASLVQWLRWALCRQHSSEMDKILEEEENLKRKLKDVSKMAEKSRQLASDYGKLNLELMALKKRKLAEENNQSDLEHDSNLEQELLKKMKETMQQVDEIQSIESLERDLTDKISILEFRKSQTMNQLERRFMFKVIKYKIHIILGLLCRLDCLTKKMASFRLHDLRYQQLGINRKVVSICLLGLFFFFTFFLLGAFGVVFNHRFNMGRERDNTTFNNYVRSESRMLIATNHVKEFKGGVNNSDMTSVDRANITVNVDGSGQQKHWSSRSEILDALYVLRNGQYVKINYNQIADEKALAHWISNNKSPHSGKHQEDTVPEEVQNRTGKHHLPAHKKLKTGVVFWTAIAAAIFAVLCSIAILWCRCRKKAQQDELVQGEPVLHLELCRVMGPREFQHHDLVVATDNFADENRLGQGGSGSVYRGHLSDQDCHVAIKVLSRRSLEQGLKEFEAEVKVLTQLRHKNIVKLFGWCNSPKGLLLVYELLAEGSLDKHLHSREKTLTWPERHKIVLDLGSGLVYLHEGCEKCIVHGDIKPANVMLDTSHHAKLGDFGLARLVEHGAEPQTTEALAGTQGYMDPEFINNGRRRPESDVYSFGVVLLEIACGERPTQPNGASVLLPLVPRVRDLYDRSMILDAADPRLNGEFDHGQMERVLVTGLWCTQRDPCQRPSIAMAMDVLRHADAKLPVLPARRDAEHVRSLDEQAFDDLPAEEPSADAVNATTTYLTSRDSDYLLANE